MGCGFNNDYLWLKTLGFLAFSPLLAHASAITSGAITISGLGPSGTFSLNGPGFAASGQFGFGNWGPVSCFPCSPGTVLSISGTQVGNDFSSGSASIGPTTFGVNWGDLNAAGASIFNIVGPAVILDSGPGTYRGTFTFAGSLCGTQGGTLPHPCAANLLDLTGLGTVDINVAGFDGSLRYTTATYIFATPEPSSWMLVSSGIIAILSLRRPTAAKTVWLHLSSRLRA
jgi:hypothetical protein